MFDELTPQKMAGERFADSNGGSNSNSNSNNNSSSNLISSSPVSVPTLAAIMAKQHDFKMESTLERSRGDNDFNNEFEGRNADGSNDFKEE